MSTREVWRHDLPGPSSAVRFYGKRGGGGISVPKDTERLGITPAPRHDDALRDDLAAALTTVWRQPDLRQAA